MHVVGLKMDLGAINSPLLQQWERQFYNDAEESGLALERNNMARALSRLQAFVITKGIFLLLGGISIQL